MAQITIDCIEDYCLGYKVYRGSVKASDLEPALWIDFHDDQDNPLGYQRPFDPKRSLDAARYAETEQNAFWPESILAIRNDQGIDDNDKVTYQFNAIAPGSKFGKLIVNYNGTRMENIGGQNFKWRRAFSQVDCQHRLGTMGQSQKFVTICIIPSVQGSEEALIFKTINDKQKQISTSLVDAIILLSRSKIEDPAVHLAFDLGQDLASPFYHKVDTEGTNISRQNYLVTLRTLKTSVIALVGSSKYLTNNISDNQSYAQFYVLVKSYWDEVSRIWPNEFQNVRGYKLMTVPGLKGLARYGRKIFRDAVEIGNNTTNLSSIIRRVGAPALDWSSSGPLINASGNSGAKAVYDLLIKKYGQP